METTKSVTEFLTHPIVIGIIFFIIGFTFGKIYQMMKYACTGKF